MPLERVAAQLEELGWNPPDEKAAGLLADDPATAAMLTFFEDARFAGPAETKDLVIPILERGKVNWFAVRDRALFDAMQGLGTPEIKGWLRWFGIPARTLRAGATLTLEFALGRNPIRDAWSSSIYSRASWRPPLWRLTEGLFHFFRRDEAYQAFRLSGAENATMLGLDRVNAQRTLRRLLATRTLPGKAWTLVRHPLDVLRLVSAATENGTRVGEFAAVERELLSRGVAPKEAATLAGLAARDVSIDFAQGGVASKAINQIVWIFNPAIRGTAQLARELRARPGTVIPRAVATITIPSLALYLSQKDDPAYRDVPSWVHNVSWVYVQRGTDRGEGWDGYGTGKVERIWYVPKPFEIGVLFGTVPERIAEWMERHEPESLDQMRKAVVDAFAPPIIPTAVVPLIENYANRSFFRDRPIVPRSREGLDPALQYRPGTGELYRWLGGELGVSPAQLENIARGYTGGLGKYATDLADAVIRTGRRQLDLPPLAPEREQEIETDPLADAPWFRAFVRREPGEDAESVERVYQRFASAERRRRTWRQLLTEGRQEEASAYLREHHDEILSVATREETAGEPGPLRVAHEALAELQKAKRAVSTIPGAGGERQQISRAIRDVSRQTVGVGGVPSPLDVERLRREVGRELSAQERRRRAEASKAGRRSLQPVRP